MLTIPENAPFSGPQRMWLKGFLDGLIAWQPSSPRTTAIAENPAAGIPLTILWGSQTGTAESLAKKLAKHLTAKGNAPKIIDMAEANVAQLSSIRHLLIITSTYGDGEPPDNAQALHEALHREEIALTDLHFSVFALGDSNYPDFCQCGRDFHKRLSQLGAKAVTPIVESDVDHDLPFLDWSSQVDAFLAKAH